MSNEKLKEKLQATIASSNGLQEELLEDCTGLDVPVTREQEADKGLEERFLHIQLYTKFSKRMLHDIPHTSYKRSHPKLVQVMLINHFLTIEVKSSSRERVKANGSCKGGSGGFNTAASYVEVKYVVASGNAGLPNSIITTLLQAKSALEAEAADNEEDRIYGTVLRSFISYLGCTPQSPKPSRRT
ncbi:hypothetical protein TURU_120848 [Turdus rufiventris]|nr:hypothetical protein TURU_120848 [Turdus rufiventris]